MPPAKKKVETKINQAEIDLETKAINLFKKFFVVFKTLFLTPNKTIGMKLVAIGFGFAFLTLGIFIMTVSFWAFKNFGTVTDKFVQGILGIPLGVLFIGLALKMIYINLREI